EERRGDDPRQVTLGAGEVHRGALSRGAPRARDGRGKSDARIVPSTSAFSFTVMSFESVTTLDMSTPEAKRASYALLLAQVRAVFEGERDWLANLSQFSSLVFDSVPDLNWAGFYIARGRELVLGPFQGKIACVRIPFDRGVCGACARTGQVQR